MKKCFETNTDVCLGLLQIRLTPLGPRLPGQATQLFNRHLKGLLTKYSRLPVLFNNDEKLPVLFNNDENHYVALIKRQPHNIIDKDTCKNILLLSTGSPVALLHEDGGPGQ